MNGFNGQVTLQSEGGVMGDDAIAAGRYMKLYTYHYSSELNNVDKIRLEFGHEARKIFNGITHVRIERSTARGLYRLRFTPVDPDDERAKRVRWAGDRCVVSGGPRLYRKYGFPLGYYFMDEDKVFTWRHA